MTIEIITTYLPDVFNIYNGFILSNNYVFMTKQRYGELCMNYYDYHEILSKLKIIHFFEKITMSMHQNDMIVVISDRDFYRLYGTINYYYNLLLENGRHPETELEVYREALKIKNEELKTFRETIEKERKQNE